MNRNQVETILLKENYRINPIGEIVNSKNDPIANIIPIPKKQIRVKGEMQDEVYIELLVIIDDNKQIDNIKLPALDMSNLKWIPSCLGMDAIVYPGKEKEFLLIIKKLFRHVETVQEYSNIGWIKQSDGQYKYLDYNGSLGDGGIKVNIEDNFRKYTFPREDGDVEVAVKQVLALLGVVEKRIAYVLLSLVYLCPLLEFIGQKSKLPEFVVWLYGFTGTHKTTIAKLFLSHFGNFNSGVPASFNDTYASIERKAYKLKDSLLLLDDFCPQQSYKETQNINTSAEKVVRAYGDRTSRGRLTVTMESQTQFVPRGMMLITGESTVPGNSTAARLIPIGLNKDSVNFNKLTEAQEHTDLLGISMREYILWIEKEVNSNCEDFVDTLNSNYKVWLDDIRKNAVETHGRSYEAVAWLLVALDLMYQFFGSIGVVKEEEAGLALEEAREEFLELIKVKDELTKADNPIELFLDTIKNLLTSQSITIKDLDSGEVIGNKYKAIEGYCDSEYYYFNSNTIYGLVKIKLSKAGVYFQLPIRALLKQLADEAIIKVEDKNNLPKKTIKNEDRTTTRLRLLHIKRQYLD